MHYTKHAKSQNYETPPDKVSEQLRIEILHL